MRFGSPLEGVLKRAGAMMVERGGHRVPAHFGSPVGELAVCSTAVGLTDRSELAKFELRGFPEAVDLIVSHLSGSQLEPNEVLYADGVAWCSGSPDRAFALCRPERSFELSEELHRVALHAPGALLTDESEELAALGLLGPATQSVLAALGAWTLETIQLPRPSFSVCLLEGLPVYLLEESATRALILAEREQALELWLLMEHLGRRFGLACVGHDAADRYGVIERRRLGRGARPAFA